MIEQVARSSAAEIRNRTAPDVDAGLVDLHVRQSQHDKRMRAGVVAAVAVAVGVGWAAGAIVRPGDHHRLSPSHSGPSRHVGADFCRADRVDCLGGRTFRFALTRPVQWRVPPGFSADSGGGPGPLMVESYRRSGEAGVTVMERVRGATPDGRAAVRGVTGSPRSFVSWVAARGFLDAGKPVRTEIDGRRAWQVQATLARGAAPGRARCNGYACHPITYQPNGVTTGIWGSMAAQYTAFRLPGAGTTVVWSWTFSGDTHDLARLDRSVRGLSWPGS